MKCLIKKCFRKWKWRISGIIVLILLGSLFILVIGKSKIGNKYFNELCKVPIHNCDTINTLDESSGICIGNNKILLEVLQTEKRFCHLN